MHFIPHPVKSDFVRQAYIVRPNVMAQVNARATITSSAMIWTKINTSIGINYKSLWARYCYDISEAGCEYWEQYIIPWSDYGAILPTTKSYQYSKKNNNYQDESRHACYKEYLDIFIRISQEGNQSGE